MTGVVGVMWEARMRPARPADWYSWLDSILTVSLQRSQDVAGGAWVMAPPMCADHLCLHQPLAKPSALVGPRCIKDWAQENSPPGRRTPMAWLTRRHIVAGAKTFAESRLEARSRPPTQRLSVL